MLDPEALEPLPPGEKGETVTRGYDVMLGYYGKPEEAARTEFGAYLELAPAPKKPEMML